MKKSGFQRQPSDTEQNDGGTGSQQGQVLPNRSSDERRNGNEEYELRVKKLAFETGWGKFFEGFRAIGTIFAAIGVIGTLALGLYQQRQNRISRDDERFDRSVARVGSGQTSERLTGLAGLQQFLVSGDADRQQAALLYLVNAATIETDPTLRSAIIDTFNSLQNSELNPRVLNAALLSARDRNRALFKRFRDRPWSATRQAVLQHGLS
jgi:hypothetical protein